MHVTYFIDNKAVFISNHNAGDRITPFMPHEKEGHTFGGWANLPDIMPDTNINVYGVYKANTYRVYLYIDGSFYKDYKVEYGAQMPEITPPPMPKGHTFSGWGGSMPRRMPAHDLRFDGRTEECSQPTKATAKDLADAVEDEYGVKYSRDGKRLLKANGSLTEYTVKPGTCIVCDEAFYWCESLQDVKLPDTVEIIGNGAFSFCPFLQTINIPISVKRIGDSAFDHCM